MKKKAECLLASNTKCQNIIQKCVALQSKKLKTNLTIDDHNG
jgi:hypothetical protein